MNTRQKGNKYEVELMQFLQELGWLVDRANPKLQMLGVGKFRSVSHDLFNCFDLVAIRPDGQVFWIQVKSNTSQASGYFKKLEELPPQINLQRTLVAVRLTYQKAKENGLDGKKLGLFLAKANRKDRWVALSSLLEI